MKDIVAQNGRNIAAVRKAFESNDNDAITKALDELDAGQSALAGLANNTTQQDSRAGAGNTKPSADDVAKGFGKGRVAEQPADKAAPQPDKA